MGDEATEPNQVLELSAKVIELTQKNRQLTEECECLRRENKTLTETCAAFQTTIRVQSRVLPP